MADSQTFSCDDWSQLCPRDDEAFVQAINLRHHVPMVIALSTYDRQPATAVTFARRNLVKRDRYICQYCGNQPGANALMIDQGVPRSIDGALSWTNCVLACVASNKHEADRMPSEAGMTLRASRFGQHGSRMNPSWSSKAALELHERPHAYRRWPWSAGFYLV